MDGAVPSESQLATAVLVEGLKLRSDLLELVLVVARLDLPKKKETSRKRNEPSTCGRGSTGTQNGTLESGSMDQNLRNPSCIILSHIHAISAQLVKRWEFQQNMPSDLRAACLKQAKSGKRKHTCDAPADLSDRKQGLKP